MNCCLCGNESQTVLCECCKAVEQANHRRLVIESLRFVKQVISKTRRLPNGIHVPEPDLQVLNTCLANKWIHARESGTGAWCRVTQPGRKAVRQFRELL